MTDEQVAMLNELLELEDDELSPWETDFIENLSKRPPEWSLSVAQADTLAKIYEDRT